MTKKITLDLPEGLHHVLRIDAAIMDCTVEEAAIHHLKESIGADLELPEMYAQVIQEIYKGPRNKGRRKRKAAE